MMLQDAKNIVEDKIEILRPHCERIESAGSVRRGKREVEDVEIVCIPKLKESTTQRTIQWINRVLELGTIIKGKPRDGKYIKIHLPEGINLDLFVARPENWGYIFAIRTGSADYSHYVLATSWVKAGYVGGNGMLTKNGIPVEVREERDLFRLIGVKYVKPEDREVWV